MTRHKYLFLANILLGLLLTAATLFLARTLVSTYVQSARQVVTTEKKEGAITRHSFNNYAQILKFNPFGFPAGALRLIDAEAATPANPPSDSQAEVSLIGTVAGDRDISYAIFMDKGGQQEVYRIGDKVFGAGRLALIEKNRAVIDVAGQRLVFPLAEISLLTDLASQPRASNPLARKIGDSLYAIDQRRVEQALENPGQLMTEARFTPHMAKGKHQGFVLSEIKPGGIYQGLGLQDGDLLLKINDYKISGPEAALRSLMALEGMDRIKLDIVRDGANLTKTYQIR